MIIDVVTPVGEMFIAQLRNPDNKNEYVAWAILEFVYTNNGTDELKIWDIHTRPKFRRKGYALELIEFIKSEKNVKIWTNYEDEKHPGAQAFLKAGFKIYKSLVNGECNRLVWKNN